MRVPKGRVFDMSAAHAYYEYEYHKGLTWAFIREEIGRGLRERYQVPKEPPAKLRALVRKLEAIESNESPHSRTLLKKLDVLEGKYLCRYAPPIEPRSVGPSDADWPLCT
jgi:hypothetical protein